MEVANVVKFVCPHCGGKCQMQEQDGELVISAIGKKPETPPEPPETTPKTKVSLKGLFPGINFENEPEIPEIPETPETPETPEGGK